MSQLDRILPQSDEVERATICSRLISPVEFGAMCEARGVTRDWFHIPANAEFYGAIEHLARENKPLDLVTIAQHLKDNGLLEKVGGPAAVSAAFFYVPTAANAGDYLETLTEKHLRRKVISIGTQWIRKAYDDTEALPELLAELHAEVTALLHRRGKRASIRDTMRSILEEIATGNPDGTLLQTGMEGLDGRLDLFRGDLLMISAPTSCGKSALAFNIGINVGLRGKRVGLYPLEMRQKQSLKRSIAQLSGYNAEFVRKLALQSATGTDSQRAAAKRAQDEFVAAAGTILGMKLHMRDDIHRIEAIEPSAPGSRSTSS
jgi:replicative DNA helicase